MDMTQIYFTIWQQSYYYYEHIFKLVAKLKITPFMSDGQMYLVTMKMLVAARLPEFISHCYP